MIGAIRRRYIITGTIQGVGFRPYLYRLAASLNLNGFAFNSTEGVITEIEGEETDIQEFEKRLCSELPPLAEITGLSVKQIDPYGEKGFEIKPSESTGDRGQIIIPPDISTCDNCSQEVNNSSNRRSNYPFTNCTDCGPRYTIIHSLPYDRKSTTMSTFTMCPDCQKEYNNPLNRRFHAEPNACPSCGPHLSLIDSSTDKHFIADESDKKILTATVDLLERGYVIALKGLGGFHLACDADNSDAIIKLRSGKQRPTRPLAVMSLDIERVIQYAEVSSEEMKILLSPQRPIVLLKKKLDSPLANEIAPQNDYYGVMLPYTPLHHLLMIGSYRALVMTSANNSGEPIIKDNDDAIRRLSGVADFILIHNRDILVRCDDSICILDGEKPLYFRLSRGFAPKTIKMNSIMPDRIACGAELKNTFCITKDNLAYLSGHIGDLEDKDTFDSYIENIDHILNILGTKPEVILHDLHPDYLSTRYAIENKIETKIGVQHHHAHTLSLMAENQLDEPIIALTLDGTGWGPDGTIWGGEIIIADRSSYEKLAHLESIPLPGGDAAAREPWRIALSHLILTYEDGYINILDEIVRKRFKSIFGNNETVKLVAHMITKKINSPLSSGMGRLFGAVSALIGIKETATYEGEAEMNLEWISSHSKSSESYDYQLSTEGNEIIIDQSTLFKLIVEDYIRGMTTEKIGRKFHNTVIRFMVEAADIIANKTGLKKILLTGGVFQNMLILRGIRDSLRKMDYTVFSHNLIPPNDAGIALGQAYYTGK